MSKSHVDEILSYATLMQHRTCSSSGSLGWLHRNSVSVSSCLPNQLHTEFIFPSQKPPHETQSYSELTEISSLNGYIQNQSAASRSGTTIRMGGMAESYNQHRFWYLHSPADRQKRQTYCYDQKLPPALHPAHTSAGSFCTSAPSSSSGALGDRTPPFHMKWFSSQTPTSE